MADHSRARLGRGRIAGRGGRGRADRGSAAAELVLITPLLMLLLLLIVAAGRLVDARLQVDSAAMQAARAASLARDPAAAVADADATAQAALASEHITCSPLGVSPDTADFTPGGQVSVQVSCTVSLAGLSLLHVPGAETLTSQFTSPIDTWRGVGP
ncbi:MAG: TadE/TadG family type IV pilus assembly protein [Streptosporangiaceae bacterium]